MSQTSKAPISPADPLIGHALGGKYTIKKLIGRGGVGLVYLADQTERNREVVVKVLAPNWADDDEALARFEREAKRLSGLKHPNIVTMYDYGKEDRRAFLVMEYLRGEPLADFVGRHGQLTLEQFVPVAAQILKGIGHAHSREMMVRDIKPANVMLCQRKGRANFVKILDFGLAKLTKGEQAITEEHVMGTVGYLSPEQIRGDEIDLRVDVYALGVLFYYMISGRLPFEGDNNATVFYKTINEPPPRLSSLLPEGHDIPEGLVDLIHSCLEKDREDRPTNADEIVEGLIDVVPAALFRLPRAETQRQGVPQPMPPGHGNTGMMELLGTEQSPSARHHFDSGAATQTAGRTSQVSGPMPQPGGPMPQHSGPMPQHSGPMSIDASGASIPVQVQQFPTGEHTGLHTGIHPPQQRPVVLLLAGALLVLGGGLAAWIFMGGTDDKNEVASSTAPAGAAVGSSTPATDVDPQIVEAALAKADTLIKGGKFDEATETLDDVRGLTQALPTLAGRIERADHKIAIGRLMAAGSQFEAQDNESAATEAYRDALELDPSYMPAREALARLDVDAGPMPEGGDDDVVFGQVHIDSKPTTAKIYIDGNPAGTTPFEGKLRVGAHAVRIVARGYYVYNEDVDVKADDNVPLAVTLKGRGKSGKGSKSGKSSKGSKGSDTDEPATAEPEPSKPPKEPESGGDNPFLPTKKKKKSGPFLPTQE